MESYSIPAGSLSSARTRFGAASGLQVLFRTSDTTGLTTGGVSGQMSPQAAISRIVEGTGLVYLLTSVNSVTVGRPGEIDAALAVSGDGSTVLPTINMRDGGGVRGPIGGYVARESASGTKTDTPIMQTARSIEVVGREEVEQRAPITFTDAVSYSSGVTTGSYGYDPRFDEIYVRGFSLTTLSDFEDGLRQIAGNYGTFRTEPYALERIDIVKGPASALYGQSTAGGLIDRVSKRPSATPVHEVMTRVDDTRRYQTVFDFGDALTDDNTWLYRVVGVGRVGEGSFDVEDGRLMLAPSLTYSSDENTELTILALAQRDETDGNVAALNKSGQVYDVRASDPDYDTQIVKQFQLGYEFTHRFGDRWTLRNNSRIGYLDTKAKYLTGSVTGGGWKTDGSGNDYYARGRYAVSDSMLNAPD
ncbi:TonB-dependent siderophore receptor [Breoghania sp.]|uniref:TonB-dependent siderophore receptor n=1 Tax=Breoghania sp. TaxID=2065378 RepID=UPI00261789BD|nr:TonB-dependent siderophore receptor [Breoghania sp.]MDJ0930598.1 TonB-dependent receptor plug domain-containing protein [Breoghania sp.]